MKECIILAGGLGTRLRSAVPDLPKCMAPVAGKPFLAYVIDYFRKQGIERFIFSLGYMHEVIEAFVQTQYPMLNVAYSIEQEPMGTGGAIKLACSKAQQKDVLVLNGDTIFTIQLDQLTTFHTSHAADCTLSLKPMQQFDRYGVVELAADHTISDFREKQYYESGYINGGVYALNVGSFLQETYGLAQDAYFIDIGIPADYEKANQEFRVMNL
jgi:D-glycero-alpha-D-manno-heptose 1-phosphate guanylyltransferase